MRIYSNRRLLVLLAVAGIGTLIAIVQRLPSPPVYILVATDTIEPGVVYRQYHLGWNLRADIVDVDLTVAKVRPIVVSDSPMLEGDYVAGETYTPAQWLQKSGGIAAINGGFFGNVMPDNKTQVIGLIVQNGKIVSPNPLYDGLKDNAKRPGHYVRGGVGFDKDGAPSITWPATDANWKRNSDVVSYTSPTPSGADIGTKWSVRDAVVCGPVIAHDGHIAISDYPEHLVMASEYPRTFVAYDGNGASKHFVLGVITGAYFPYLARFLEYYFRVVDDTHLGSAVCLDGGPSSQLSFRQGHNIVSPLATGVECPDAIILVPSPRPVAASVAP